MKIEFSIEEERLCGWRKPGSRGYGIYLVGSGNFAGCGRLPFPIEPCPHCGQTIEQSRGWTKFRPAAIFGSSEPRCMFSPCFCPMMSQADEGWILWVGAEYYSPHSFRLEARNHGISKKIPNVPKNFKFGQVVYLAHPEAIVIPSSEPLKPPEKRPGIFMTFVPTGIEIVVKDVANIPEDAIKLAEKHDGKIIQVKKQETWELL